MYLFLLIIFSFMNTIRTSYPPNEKLKRLRHLKLAPALLLTTADSISLIYPKEMGYAKDFLHTIYKLNNDLLMNRTSGKRAQYRIEDAVYDNRTWSIYFILSNSSSGSQIIRLTHLLPVSRLRLVNNSRSKTTFNTKGTEK